MKIGARRSPWRAVPPPFWRPNFLPVRATSLRSRAARAGARRLTSCQVTTRWRMSARGSTAKISSLSSMSPPLPASRVCTLTFILAFLALVVRAGLRSLLARRSVRGLIRVRGRAGFLLGGDRGDFLVARQRRDFVHRSLIDQTGLRHFQFLDLAAFEDRRRIRRRVRTRQLDRVADRQPRALVTGHRALDEQQPADRVGADHLEVLLGAVTSTHMAGHLLVLEHAARILAVARRTVRAVRNGNAVSRAKTAEAPALHRAGEALALGQAGDVDELAGDEVIGADMRAHVEQGILGDAELGDLYLRLDLGLAERGALRLGDVLCLGLAGAKLDGGVAVAVRLAAADDLQLFQLQNGDGHVPTVRLEQARHSDLLRDHAGAHDQTPPQRHPNHLGCVQPNQFFACPAWASAP